MPPPFFSVADDSLLVVLAALPLMAQAAATNTDWLGFTIEGYVFAAFGFFVFCFGMSRYSQRLERELDTGHR